MENLTKKIEYRYLKDKELYNLYVDFNLDDPWEKFNEIEKLKYFKVNDLFPYNSKDDSHYHIYFCAFLNDKIIGMLKLKVGGNHHFVMIIGRIGYVLYLYFLNFKEIIFQGN